jgi:hypothetical protein
MVRHLGKLGIQLAEQLSFLFGHRFRAEQGAFGRLVAQPLQVLPHILHWRPHHE